MPLATAYVLDIPGWRPALANELLRAHWSKRHRLKARDTKRVSAAAFLAGIPPVRWPRMVEQAAKHKGLDLSALPDPPTPRKRRVTITIHGKSYHRPSQTPDADGPLKSLLDALVNAGLLVDDSGRWCEWSCPRFERGPKRTVITLEDLD